ncbi:MAG: HPF/RaiA family ribosome-associated protein [Myxococcota bacterium]
MAELPNVVIRFKDVEQDELLRQEIDRRTQALAEEFPETTRFEISLEEYGAGFRIHAHVNGKNTEVATHGVGPELRTAADQLFHRVKQQLRRMHDKHIFLHRREAQKSSKKK